MNRKGILAVVSGFSGAGKGTLMKLLTERYDNYSLSVSATTRSPREGEKDGRDYFFVTREEFSRMIRDDELLEYARYVDNYYGTPRKYVEGELEKGKDVILEIEIQGALSIKERYPDSLLIFVTPPSAKELKKRLTQRGTETEEKIRKRLKRAAEEAVGVENYDYILINDDLEEAVLRLHRLIQDQHMRVGRQLDFISDMRGQLADL